MLALIIALIGFSSQALPLQTPWFEVASVKQNNDHSVRPALKYTPSGVDFAGVPLTWIIGEAYQLPYYSSTAIVATDDAVRGLLIPTNRYDISARAEGSVSRNVIRLMLQSLLAERFKLTLHHEPKDQVSAVYHLKNVTTPMLLAVGDDGYFFPGGGRTVHSLRLQKKDVTLLRYAGQGHGFSGAALTACTTRETAFFDRHLKPGNLH